MAALPIFKGSRMQVTVRNTFVDMADPCSPAAARSSSTPPSLDQNLIERSITVAKRSITEAGLEGSDADDGTTEHSEICSVGELEDPSFQDTDDEWEVGSSQAPHARRLSDVSKSLFLAPRAEPAVSSPAGASGVVMCYSPVVNVFVCPSVPAYCDKVIVASDPGGARSRKRRCSRCRGRLGVSCPCSSRQVGRGPGQDAACGPHFAKDALAPPMPRSHAHAISVKNVLVDAEEAPQAPAETKLKVRCAGGHEGIVVERAVQRSRLSGKAREWLAARGAAGPAACPAGAAGPTALGRTKLTSTARAFQPAVAGAVLAPAAPAPSADAEVPREEAPEPPAPGTAPGAPKFGSALLRCLEGVLRKNAFVARVASSADGGGGWRVQIDVRSRHLYLKEHVLACAQEALFDGLDKLEALRTRGPSAGCSIPDTVFHLSVRCPDPS